jgi:hypothetical protein
VIANTGHVKVSWVVGSASVSLVWLVIFSAILGMLLCTPSWSWSCTGQTL